MKHVCSCGEGPYTYYVASSNATITLFDSAYSGILSITNFLGGYPVTAIRSFASHYRDGLTSVTIGNSVTTVRHDAFYDCSSLQRACFTGDAPTPSYAVFRGAPT